MFMVAFGDDMRDAESFLEIVFRCSRTTVFEAYEAKRAEKGIVDVGFCLYHLVQGSEGFPYLGSFVHVNNNQLLLKKIGTQPIIVSLSFNIKISILHWMVLSKRRQPFRQNRNLLPLDERGAGAHALFGAAAGVQ